MSIYCIERYRLIDRIIGNNRFPSLEEIKTYVNRHGAQPVSVSQIQKDLHKMRSCQLVGYFAPIIWNSKRRGYGYDAEFYTIDVQVLLKKLQNHQQNDQKDNN